MTAQEQEGATRGDVIVLDHVAKRFADFVAVQDACFSIGRGEFFSHARPVGLRQDDHAADDRRLRAARRRAGSSSTATTSPARRPTGATSNTVFQHYALFPHMTVFDNVAFGLRSAQGRARPRSASGVGEMLEIVRIGRLRRPRKPGQLSGGQQQRVALARALVNQPTVLLLDEPLGALDLKLRQAMQLELKRIQREVGITFVFVTHDQEEALTMSDRIAVMSDGRVEQIGTPDGDLPPARPRRSSPGSSARPTCCRGGSRAARRARRPSPLAGGSVAGRPTWPRAPGTCS